MASPLIIAALCREEVKDLDIIIHASPGSTPPSICKIFLPRVHNLLKKSYPEVKIIPIYSKECIEQNKELIQQCRACLIIDSTPDLFGCVFGEYGSRLEWVHSYLAGVDKIIPYLCEFKRGEKSMAEDDSFFLTNSKGGFSRSLAEWVITTALFHIKNIPRFQKNKLNKKWDRHIVPEIYKKTIGFVGYGDIAKITAQTLQPFGVRCIAMRRSAQKDDLLDACYSFNDPEAMKVYEESDIVISTLPGTTETKNFIGARAFSAMKKTAYFISIGRGTVVDEEALNKALIDGEIGGAALDVFQVEPLPQTSPLWDAPNLLISSHCADWNEDYGSDDILDIFKKNLDAFLKGAKMQKDMYTPCNKMLGY